MCKKKKKTKQFVNRMFPNITTSKHPLLRDEEVIKIEKVVFMVPSEACGYDFQILYRAR